MGTILQSFTFDRNTLKDGPLQSAIEAERHITLSSGGSGLTKAQSNIVGALRSFTGALGANGKPTDIGDEYLRLFNQNKEDAWRWLLTRSLWLYVVPNGTAAKANSTAASKGIAFNFFHLMIGVMTHLSALPGDRRFFYYDEIFGVLDEDDNWGLDAGALFEKVIAWRSTTAGTFPPQRTLLDDLEPSYGVSRDNLNTVLSKALGQTGLFEYRNQSGAAKGRSRRTGIALSSDLDPVLQRRLRFVLDNAPPAYNSSSGTWLNYLLHPPADFPKEVSFSPAEVALDEDDEQDLSSLVEAAAGALRDAGLLMPSELIRRFAASLLAKKFVILTGLSGSGKTRLATSFARWITARSSRASVTPLLSGLRVWGDAAASAYTVGSVSPIGVHLRSDESSLESVLPIDLVEKAEAFVRGRGDAQVSTHDLLADLTSDELYEPAFLSSIIHPLLAIANMLSALPSQADQGSSHYEVVPVGADWTGKENIFGYADALNNGIYVRTTPVVNLVLRAEADPKLPYFLVLDEMNLSHVERYFSEFLSVMESDEEMVLHGSASENGKLDGVPSRIRLPNNLFIIGTVNIDETTYTFSPKVLDRANSIEFRVEADQMESFLAVKGKAKAEELDGKGRKFGKAFIAASMEDDCSTSAEDFFSSEMALLFRVLASYGAEFGFRTAQECRRFVAFHERLTPVDWRPEHALDALICQKLLPRMNGSRRKLEPLLCALALLCCLNRDFGPSNDPAVDPNDVRRAGYLSLEDRARLAASLEMDALNPLSDDYVPDASADPFYPVSFGKIRRMLIRLSSDGFVSFAEA